MLFTEYIGKIQNKNLYIYVFLFFKKIIEFSKGSQHEKPSGSKKIPCNHSIPPPCFADREPEPGGCGRAPHSGSWPELGAGFLQGCMVLCSAPFLLPHHFPSPSSSFILRIKAGTFSCVAWNVLDRNALHGNEMCFVLVVVLYLWLWAR